MRTLDDFQLPNDGEICLCEINGHVHSMACDYANVNKFTNTVSNFYLFKFWVNQILYFHFSVLGRKLTANFLHSRFITSSNIRWWRSVFISTCWCPFFKATYTNLLWAGYCTSPTRRNFPQKFCCIQKCHNCIRYFKLCK